MAKTILEDISAFLAQNNSWTNDLKFDIENLLEQDKNNLIFIKEQMNNLKISVDNSIYDINLKTDNNKKDFDDTLVKYKEQLKIIKEFIAKAEATRIIEIKKLNVKVQQEHDFVVRELYGAAEDRVDIRQELGYEITKRRSQLNLLNKKIESEILDRIDKQNLLKTELESSISATNLNVTNLQNSLISEVKNREDAIKDTQNLIQAEATTRGTENTTLSNRIDTLSNAINTEKADRTNNITSLTTSLSQAETRVKEFIVENETRRISDLGILAARDNLEENESKKRDYNIYKDLKDIYSSAPLKTFSDDTNDWDTLSSSTTTANTTSTETNDGSAKHGLLPNVIRKLNKLAKKLQGSTTDVYNSDAWATTNDQVGLDYWTGSDIDINTNTIKYKGINIIEASGTSSSGTLYLGNGYSVVDLVNGMLEANKTSKTLTLSSNVTTINATSTTAVNFNSSTTTVTAFKFSGTATQAYYADLAERYEADNIYPIGTVVAIGGDKEITIYNPHLPYAGVVSENPAFRMNNNAEKEMDENYINYNPYIALKGRIPVKIVGEAKKGDYICAHINGQAKAYSKLNLPMNYNLILIGIALNNSINNMVEVKI